MLKPARILSLEIKPAKDPDWSQDELDKLTGWQRQEGLFDDNEAARKDVKVLEKVPFDFYYHCQLTGESTTRRIKLVDWEVGALYRRLRWQHGSEGWESRFRQKYEQELPAQDLLLMMGTVHRFPDQWLGISVFAPPKPQPEDSDQGSLF